MYGTFIYSVIILFSAFEYKGGEPASLFPFTIAAENYQIPGIYTNPLSIPVNEGLTISAYGSKPYLAKGLHSYTSGLKYSSGNYGAQFLWNSFGADFYSENRFTAGSGISVFNIISFGADVSAYKLKIDTDEESFSRTLYDTDIAAQLIPWRWLSLSVIQNCALTAFSDKNSMELYPEKSAGILLKPSGGFSISWNLTDTSADYINSFGADITPAKFLSLRGGYTPEDSRFAASVTFILNKLYISYSIASHPYLGYTHSFGITCSTDSDIETISYRKSMPEKPETKININSASDDEIKNIPELSSRSSGRIILYRIKAGPVTEKTLTQLGLDNDEIDSVKINCYGFARDQRKDKIDDEASYRNKKRKSKPYIPRKELIRERFRKMIKAGIPAATAIRYSELPGTAGRTEIESILDEDPSLTYEQKDSVRKICAE